MQKQPWRRRIWSEVSFCMKEWGMWLHITWQSPKDLKVWCFLHFNTYKIYIRKAKVWENASLQGVYLSYCIKYLWITETSFPLCLGQMRQTRISIALLLVFPNLLDWNRSKWSVSVCLAALSPPPAAKVKAEAPHTSPSRAALTLLSHSSNNNRLYSSKARSFNPDWLILPVKRWLMNDWHLYKQYDKGLLSLNAPGGTGFTWCVRSESVYSCSALVHWLHQVGGVSLIRIVSQMRCKYFKCHLGINQCSRRSKPGTGTSWTVLYNCLVNDPCLDLQCWQVLASLYIKKDTLNVSSKSVSASRLKCRRNIIWNQSKIWSCVIRWLY